jgi:hypothetical protein
MSEEIDLNATIYRLCVADLVQAAGRDLTAEEIEKIQHVIDQGYWFDWFEALSIVVNVALED